MCLCVFVYVRVYVWFGLVRFGLVWFIYLITYQLLMGYSMPIFDSFVNV